jgi:predicted amidohydrolase YtcJ
MPGLVDAHAHTRHTLLRGGAPRRSTASVRVIWRSLSAVPDMRCQIRCLTRLSRRAVPTPSRIARRGAGGTPRHLRRTTRG